MIRKILYHKPSKEIIAIKKPNWVFSTEEQTGDFIVVDLDTDNYDTETRMWTVTLGTQSKTFHLSKLMRRLDLDDFYNFTESAEVQALIDQEEEEFIHNKLVEIA